MKPCQGYDEETLTHIPTLENAYGQDGFGWYVDTETADLLFPRHARRASSNPLFVYLPGMTRAKLLAAGFIA